MNYDAIITDIMKSEGWDTYTDHPDDRGGPTKWGITQSRLSDFRGEPVTPSAVAALTETEARNIYLLEYITGPRFNCLPREIQYLVIDCGVNHGTRRAAKWVQRSCGAQQDGIIGPKTLEALEQDHPLFHAANICAYRVRFYGEIVRRDRSQAAFIGGWNNRAAKFILQLADQINSM